MGNLLQSWPLEWQRFLMCTRSRLMKVMIAAIAVLHMAHLKMAWNCEHKQLLMAPGINKVFQLSVLPFRVSVSKQMPRNESISSTLKEGLSTAKTELSNSSSSLKALATALSAPNRQEMTATISPPQIIKDKFQSGVKLVQREVERKCTSPEYHQHHMGNQCFRLRAHGNSTETLSDLSMSPAMLTFAKHLYDMANEIERKFKSKCASQVVVYGAAFGQKYIDLIWSNKRHKLYEEQKKAYKEWQTKRAKTHVNTTADKISLSSESSSCRFMFVLDQKIPQREQELIRKALRQAQKDPSKKVNMTQNFDGLNGRPSAFLPEMVLLNATGENHVILVRQHLLPFSNHRRNIKLIKLNPHLLFPWAQRVMWIDGKMQSTKRFPHRIGVESYFQQTVDRQPKIPLRKKEKNTSFDPGVGVCGSFVSLPLSPVTMGNGAVNDSKNGSHSNKMSSVRYGAHCDCIREAAQYRPNVSDSLESVQKQCEFYLRKVIGGADNSKYNSDAGAASLKKNSSKTMGSRFDHDLRLLSAPALDTTLVDSAVIAWDFRTKRCRDFVDRLLCTWLKEIHCFSDRDQLSFGYALQRLQEQTEGEGISTTKTTSTTKTKTTTTTAINSSSTTESPTTPSYQLQWRHEHDNRVVKFPENSHRILVDVKTQLPFLFFVKSQCHWYSGKSALFHCNYNYRDEISDKGKKGT